MNTAVGLNVGRANNKGACHNNGMNTTTANENSTSRQNGDINNSSNQCKNVEMAVKIIELSKIVCFDVDSTLIEDEGIDALASYCEKGGEVARVTKEAMSGTMSFQEALQKRLDIIKPSQEQIRKFLLKGPNRLTQNVKRFIEQLQKEGKEIYLISGGFYTLIEPLALELKIPVKNIYANKLMFFYDGTYADFDRTQPTSRSGGKAEAITAIRKHYPPETVITMIGDGATDLEAVPPANYFIGFGGNVLRPEVHRRAQYYITNFQQLMS